ncbi:MAG: HEAT repeat domain-containing protein [Blastocatellia bacterium]
MMMTALMFSTLLGAATSYPLLKRWTEVDEARLAVIEGRWQTASIPLIAALLILPFFNYPLPHALLIAVTALSAAWSPLLALLVVTGAFLWWSELWILLVALPLLLSPLLLFMLLLRSFRDAIGAIFEAASESIEKFNERKMSLIRAAVFASLWILASETALLSADSGMFPAGDPGLCAWLGGERAVPVLMRSLLSNNWELEQNARESLADIGPAALKSLTAALDDGSAEVRARVAAALVLRKDSEGLVRSGKLSVPVLASLLRHQDYRVREKAAAKLMLPGRSVIPALIAELKRKNYDSNAEELLVNVLRQFCDVSDAPALLEVAKSENHRSWIRSSTLLASFGKPVIPLLIQALGDPNENVRLTAGRSLSEIGSPAVPALLEAFRKGSTRARAEAVTAVGKIDDKAAVPALLEALRDKDSSICELALSALETTRWDIDKSCVSDLIRLLDDPDVATMLAAATILGGINDKTALPVLLKKDAEFHARTSDHYDHSAGAYPICSAVEKLKAR